MESMTSEEMIRRKKELHLTNAMIAERSGVPVGTVQKIFGGISKKPRFDTVQALRKVLYPEENKPLFSDRHHGTESVYMVREEVPVSGLSTGNHRVYGEDKPYRSAGNIHGTLHLADYLALPEGKRAELIDGVLYDMAAPTTAHQMIAGRLYAKLLDFIESQKGTCIPFMAPTDVQLDRDDLTVVQPDVFVVCDRERISGQRITGAPDLIIEILSDSSRAKDMYIKSAKYKNAGVREYWMIDPIRKTVLVYDFSHEDVVGLYGFDAEVPVGIFDGALKIDFRQIEAYIRFLE